MPESPKDCLGHPAPPDRGSATGDVRAKGREAEARRWGSTDGSALSTIDDAAFLDTMSETAASLVRSLDPAEPASMSRTAEWATAQQIARYLADLATEVAAVAALAREMRDEPLSERDRALIDAAWQRHVAAHPAPAPEATDWGSAEARALLERGLEWAASVFDEYAVRHARKGTPEADQKADANRACAARCRLEIEAARLLAAPAPAPQAAPSEAGVGEADVLKRAAELLRLAYRYSPAWDFNDASEVATKLDAIVAGHAPPAPSPDAVLPSAVQHHVRHNPWMYAAYTLGRQEEAARATPAEGAERGDWMRAHLPQGEGPGAALDRLQQPAGAADRTRGAGAGEAVDDALADLTLCAHEAQVLWDWHATARKLRNAAKVMRQLRADLADARADGERLEKELARITGIARMRQAELGDAKGTLSLIAGAGCCSKAEPCPFDEEGVMPCAACLARDALDGNPKARAAAAQEGV